MLPLRLACLAAALTWVPFAHAEDFVPSARCQADLAAVDASFEETQARLDKVTKADKVEMCAAIKHHVEVMANGINVFQRCQPPGHDKGENIAQLAASIGDFFDINAAQGCAALETPKIDWPPD